METVWGLNTPGAQRGALLLKLAELIEQNKEELAALEALDNGRPIIKVMFQMVIHATREIVFVSPFGGHTNVQHCTQILCWMGR
jgi:acyl-CoA reductase-like NAD-dependent aldehyde dehydrogenase